ncbi:MAG TPA: hypothetical protein VHW04_00195 [Solirubrobacteraceae bacterium]|jgi:hypothetical protein|nr:hypothetical protein [Solirubrobacteraceae bacterium]
MTPPRPDPRSNQLRTALEHAQRLTDPRPEGSAYSEAWSAQATHVGDLSVLALAALRD